MRGIGHVPGRIVRAISTLVMAADNGLTLVVERIESEPWASVTFEGHRHLLTLRLEGAREQVCNATARIARDLAEVDIPLAGQFVADIAVETSDVAGCGQSDGVSMVVTALTLLD